ncbi:Hcp family type VI secretion system effector [Acidicapsa dinghuensis]|uniref:Hcp family type VI secretion system effector n=1 Tax=Acidicapsa dinghuensis TaxID=2218256 RepID=A0ABW1E9N5_9BACT|nr:type VI secretion system tube protein Hcp [Acidicapsa dinghuensis]
MATDAYLYIDGVKGESTDSQHKDWIEIASYSGAAIPTAAEPLKAAAAKQTNVSQHGSLSIAKHVDSSSPKLYELCSKGTHIKKATIEVMRPSGGKQVKYLVIEMTDVVISGFSPDPGPSKKKTHAGKVGAEMPTEQLSLNYSKIQYTYTKQNDTGSTGQKVAQK